ncbi:MAG: conjugal transfer protein TraL [Giesbergeria sp.]|nr:conjugal transfer protein TraL [Giesbergeria sp.]
MNNVHLVMQGKGGVGKSLAAVLVAQYLQSLGGKVICADTDPVNATFAQYRSLDVAHVEIAKGGNVIQSKFDPLIEMIVKTDADFVIDNGAATFLPLTKYLAENDIYQIMSEHGKKVFVHSVLTGGQAKTDTYNGFAELLGKVNQYAKVVVWENEFWGPVEYEGHPITSTKLFKESDRAGIIAGVVKLVDRSQSDAFVEDMKKMTSNHMTLADVNASEDFNFLAKNRLKKIVDAVFAELDRVRW